MATVNVDQIVRHVGFSACSCGWTVVKATVAEAGASAQVHAALHRSRGRGAILPIIPISRISSWSPAAAAGAARLTGRL